jgi:hypothetical protein
LGQQPHNEYPIKKQWNLGPLPCITLIQPVTHFSLASTFGLLCESVLVRLLSKKLSNLSTFLRETYGT